MKFFASGQMGQPVWLKDSGNGRYSVDFRQKDKITVQCIVDKVHTKLRAGMYKISDKEIERLECALTGEMPKSKTKVVMSKSAEAPRRCTARSRITKVTNIKQIKIKVPKPKKVPKSWVPENSQLVPLPHIKLMEDSFTNKSTNEFDVDDLRMSCYQTIYFVLTKNYAKLKHLCKNDLTIPSLTANRSVDITMDAVAYAIKQKDKKSLEILLAAEKCGRPAFPPVLFLKLGTGSYNRRSLGISRIQDFQASRGNREGVNALGHDIGDCSDDVRSGKNKFSMLLLSNDFDVDFVKKHTEVGLNNYHFERVHELLYQGAWLNAGKVVTAGYADGSGGFNTLHRAALSEDKHVPKQIRPASVIKKAYRSNNITPLHCAAVNPNPIFLEKYLEVSPDYHASDRFGKRLVHYAVMCPTSTATLELLLKRNVSYTDIDSQGFTPLMLAAKLGRTEHVKLLINKASQDCLKYSSPKPAIAAKPQPPKNDDAEDEGADDDDDEDTGVSPEELVYRKFGCCAIKRGTRSGNKTALWFAAFHGHTDIVLEILKRQPDMVDSITKDKQTPLMGAAGQGHLDCVKALIETGKARIEMRDNRRRTALLIAVLNGQLHVVSYLLRLGSDPNAADSSGNCCIHYASAYGWESIAKQLIAANCDCNVTNDWKLTPAAVAFLKSHPSLTQMLIKQPGVNADFVDTNGQTLMMLICSVAISNHVFQQAKTLVTKFNADVKAIDATGCNALHLVANHEPKFCRTVTSNHYTASYMVESQAEVDEFHKAQYDLVELLIKHGCSVDQKNFADLSPLDVAVNTRNIPLVKQLFAHGDRKIFLAFPRLPAFENDETAHKANILHDMADEADIPETLEILKILVATNKQDVVELLQLKNEYGRTPYLQACRRVSRIKFDEDIKIPGNNHVNVTPDQRKLHAKERLNHVTAFLDYLLLSGACPGKMLGTQATILPEDHQYLVALLESKKSHVTKDDIADTGDAVLRLRGGARTKQTARFSTGGRAPRRIFGAFKVSSDSSNFSGLTPLHYLCQAEACSDDLTVLKNFEAACNRAQANLFGKLMMTRTFEGDQTPLALAVEQKNLAVIDYLTDKKRLDQGSIVSALLYARKPEPKSKERLNLLWDAFDQDDVNVALVEKLLEIGVTPKHVNPKNGRNFVHHVLASDKPPQQPTTPHNNRPFSRPYASGRAFAYNRHVVNRFPNNTFGSSQSNPPVNSNSGKTNLAILKLIASHSTSYKVFTLPDKFGLSAYHYAVTSCKDTAQDYIAFFSRRFGLNPLVKDKQGRTVIHLCFIPTIGTSGSGNKMCHQQKLPIRKDGESFDPVMLLSVLLEEIKKFAKLTEFVNTQDVYGRTPLHYAAIVGAPVSCTHLFDSGADPLLTDENGNTAQGYAALFKNESTFLLIRQHSCSSPMDGFITLHADENENNEDTEDDDDSNDGNDDDEVKDGMDKGLQWRYAVDNAKSQTPVAKKIPLFRQLVKNDWEGCVLLGIPYFSPIGVIHECIKSGATNYSEMFIKRLIASFELENFSRNQILPKLFAPDEEGRNLLHLIALHEHHSSLRLLLDNFIRVECKLPSEGKLLLFMEDKHGCTPLHYACLTRDAELIELYISIYVDCITTMKDKAQRTLLHAYLWNLEDRPLTSGDMELLLKFRSKLILPNADDRCDFLIRNPKRMVTPDKSCVSQGNNRRNNMMGNQPRSTGVSSLKDAALVASWLSPVATDDGRLVTINTSALGMLVISRDVHSARLLRIIASSVNPHYTGLAIQGNNAEMLATLINPTQHHDKHDRSVAKSAKRELALETHDEISQFMTNNDLAFTPYMVAHSIENGSFYDCTTLLALYNHHLEMKHEVKKRKRRSMPNNNPAAQQVQMLNNKPIFLPTASATVHNVSLFDLNSTQDTPSRKRKADTLTQPADEDNFKPLLKLPLFVEKDFRPSHHLINQLRRKPSGNTVQVAHDIETDDEDPDPEDDESGDSDGGDDDGDDDGEDGNGDGDEGDDDGDGDGEDDDGDGGDDNGDSDGGNDSVEEDVDDDDSDEDTQLKKNTKYPTHPLSDKNIFNDFLKIADLEPYRIPQSMTNTYAAMFDYRDKMGIFGESGKFCGFFDKLVKYLCRRDTSQKYEKTPSMRVVNSMIAKSVDFLGDADDFEKDFFARHSIKCVKTDDPDSQTIDGDHMPPEVDAHYPYNSVDAKIACDPSMSRYWDVLLTKIESNVRYRNSTLYNFYHMQIVHHPSRNLYVLFTRWGRMGDVGQYQTTPFPTYDETALEFKRNFRAKTANTWTALKSLHTDFVHKPRKYSLNKRQPLIYYENWRPFVIKFNFDLKRTNLAPGVYGLLKGLLNAGDLLDAYSGSNIDKHSLPFGVMHMDTISEAEDILLKAGDIAKRAEVEEDKDKFAQMCDDLLALSTSYYRLLPTSGFELTKVTPLVSSASINAKLEEIRVLRNLETAMKIVMAAYHRQHEINPCDYVYSCIQTGIRVMPQSEPMRDHILHYIDKSASKTIKVRAVYELTRPTEQHNIRISGLANQWLVWHGTPKTNLLGILQLGLVAARPATHGRTYGNGIYTSTAFSKSVNYCRSHDKSKIMLLCRAALGKTSVDNVPPIVENHRFDSTVHQGMPDYNFNMLTKDGAVLPLGESPQNEIILKTGLQQSLEYLIEFE